MLKLGFQRIKKIGMALQNRLERKDVFYIVDGRDWAVRHIGEDIVSNLNKAGIGSRLTVTCEGITDSIVHYGSIHVFMPDKNRINAPHKSNKVVVTYFHVLPEDKRMENIGYASTFVDTWHTTNNIARDKLIFHGISEEKIAVVPLGIDAQRFRPVSADEKLRLRIENKIPTNRIVIGSFQKDGVGWGEGNEPKLEKGPKVLCDSLEELARVYSVYVLLIGPARGYVKNRLEKAGIQYRYIPYVDYRQIHKFYSLLDLYLITSRIEGGPRALLECMASSVPFVTTRVGMPADLVVDYKNGLISDIDDTAEITKKARQLIEDSELRKRLCTAMRDTALKHTWDKVISELDKKIYKRLKAG